MRLADLPNDVVVDILVNQRGFAQKGAELAVKNFRATMKYAGMETSTEFDRQHAWRTAMRKVSRDDRPQS